MLCSANISKAKLKTHVTIYCCEGANLPSLGEAPATPSEVPQNPGGLATKPVLALQLRPLLAGEWPRALLLGLPAEDLLGAPKAPP